LPDVQAAYPALKRRFEEEFGKQLHLISAASHAGLEPLLKRIIERLAAPKPSLEPET
jgi:hypothetical protein